MLLDTNYAFSYQLCSKLCRHNWESPNYRAPTGLVGALWREGGEGGKERGEGGAKGREEIFIKRKEGKQSTE